ncbi:unnamed protein product [marine sediment metagenome]|uniref:Uncharacterized protein n=1 Tax=marine sediment metagenome TaxID=412755 RepID=X1JH08_9ZZZZ
MYVRGCSEGVTGGGGELVGCGEVRCGEGCKGGEEGGKGEEKNGEVEQVTAQASGETVAFN